MIRIVKGKAPQKLQTDGVARTREHCAAYDADPKEYNNGRAQFKFSAAIYGDRTVRAALEKVQSGKCCYCEVVIRKPHALSHVEHYRPKAYSQQSRKDNKRFPGYYWLAYEWDNLLLACHFCNSSNKKNLFPLAHQTNRAKNHHGDIGAEEPLIIRPDGLDDPRDHIDFHHEIPVGKTLAGETTVELLGLDRREHESRLRLFNELRYWHWIVVKYRGDTSSAATELVALAHEQLTSAVRPDAPFSAMASAFLDRNPLP